MADHSKPALGSTYTNFVSELDARLDDLAVGIDPAVTTATNVPTNAIRWTSASNKWQKWSGSAWSDLATTYAISISGNAGTVTNGLYSSGSYANPAWLTSLAGSKISGNISGNAGTATKLATARNINGVAFDGSAAISVNTNQSLTFNNGGSGAASGTTFNGGTARTISYNTVGAPKADGTGATGTWPISVSGSAANATAFISSNFIITDLGTSTLQFYSGGGVDLLATLDSAGNFEPAGGVGKKGIFYDSAQTLSVDHTTTTGFNSMAAGPIAIASGITLTVSDGCVVTIV